MFKKYIYLKSMERGTDLSAESLKMVTTTRADPSCSQEPRALFWPPTEWQGPKYLSHLLLFPGLLGSGSEVDQALRFGVWRCSWQLCHCVTKQAQRTDFDRRFEHCMFKSKKTSCVWFYSPLISLNFNMRYCRTTEKWVIWITY